MKNVTFSADEDLIERAREVAKAEHKTLNVAFREWLAGYGARKGNVQRYRALIRVAGVAWGRVEVWVGATLQKQLGNFEIASVDGVEERRHTLFVGLI